jgi:hypothetical protein
MNFKLEKRESKIAGHKFVERYNPIILKEILEANKANKLLDQKEETKIRKLIGLSGENGEYETIYKYGTGRENGRTWCTNSLGNCWSRVKATVFKDYPNLKDIDMVNGGITIMHQIGLHFGLKDTDMKYIKDYIKNRDILLQLVESSYIVTKPIAKQLFIVLSNGGTVNTWIKKYGVANIKTKEGKPIKLPFVEGLTEEFIKIGQKYIERYPEIINKISKELTDEEGGNLYGSAVSRLYQDTENQCLEILLLELGFPRHSYLQHDGATVDMEEVERTTGLSLDDILEVVNSTIKWKLNIDVKYIDKKFDESLPREAAPEDGDAFLRFDPDTFNELITYEDKKKYFEIFHCKVKMPDVRYIYQKFDKLNSKNNITPYTEEGIQKYGRNLYVDIPKLSGGKKNKVETLESMPFIPIWIRDKNMREYDNFEFIPQNKIMANLKYWSGVKEEHFNSFRGYSPKCAPSKRKISKKTKDQILEPWLEIVFELCGAVKEQSDAYLDFLAHMIQKPNEKAPIAFIIKSLQGVGKNMTLEPISKMLNDYFITSSNINDFIGTHANGFFQKLLVNLNECQMNKNSFDYEGQIKTFITEDTISLNEKHEKRITVRNVARLLIFSQKPNPIPMDVKTINRRFNVFQSTDKFIGMPDEFWAERMNLFGEDIFISILYEFLNTRDISKIKWKPIITKGYIEMCAQFIPVEVLFLEDFISSGYSESNIKSETLYRYYTAFTERAGIKKELIVSNPKLTNLLKDLDIGIEKVKIGGQSYLTIDIADIKRRLILKQLIQPDADDEKVAAHVKEYKKLDFSIIYEDEEDETDEEATTEGSSTAADSEAESEPEEVADNLSGDNESFNEFIAELLN